MKRATGRNILGWTWAVSIALHVGAFAGFGWVALRSMEARQAQVPPAPPPGAGARAVELPGISEGALITVEREVDRTGDPPPPTFGGSPSAHLDQAHAGRGGDAHVDAPATNLSDTDDRIQRTLDPLNRLDRAQQQRLKTSKERASREDRRSSKEPSELSFLASGDGTRAERRTPSPSDPSRGLAVWSPASARGGAPGDHPRENDGPEPHTDLGADHEGALASTPGMGVRDGRAGRDHRSGAHVMRARPDVTLAAVSVAAPVRGRPRDDVDSDQEVATAIQSIVHASTAGGALGEGRGGAEGEGDPSAGGRSGHGSIARPAGPGDSEWWDLNTNDPHLLPYFRRIHSKLDPLWAKAFPLWAALDLRQGTVIFEVTIAADGTATPHWPPMRPSGVPEFDRNCYDAIRRGSPFDPIPAALNVSELHVRMPFDAQNYIVK